MKTKFGNAHLTPQGYYRIHSRTDGNRDKYLHRMIWEDFYGTGVPEGFVIHHKDGDKTNNCILNLQLMRKSEHDKLHNVGKSLELDDCLIRSKTMGTSNYFRVYISKDKTCKQGFKYNYQYYDNSRRRKISSVDIERLKEKVISKGLEWRELN